MKRIVLCFPNNGAAAKDISVHLPLSVLAAATMVNQFYEIKIFDGRLEDIHRFLELLNDETILVGISAITGIQIKYGIELSKLAKQKGIATVWGGTHPSLLAEETLKDENVDYVIKGEGEKALLFLAKQLELGIKPKNKILDMPIDNFDDVPDIPYELINIENYVSSVYRQNLRKLPFMFSRGCPFHCGYCSSGYLTKKVKAISVDKAVERLKNIIDKFNIQYIDFFDENLTSDISLLNELAYKMPKVKWMMQGRLDSIKKLDLEMLIENGLDLISSGVESGSPSMLKLMKKGEKVEDYIENNRILGRYEIQSRYSFMMGFPNETMKDLMDTIDLALLLLSENKNLAYYPFYVFQPYPGTPLANKFDVKGYGELSKWADFGRHNYDTPFVGDRAELFEKITFSSKYVGRLFINMFPKDNDIAELTNQLSLMWKKHDFHSSTWNDIYEKHKKIIHHHFGEHAY